MLDLSNNNSMSWAPAAYNFKKAYDQGGQRRVYFKCTEGRGFVDSRTPPLAKKAQKQGMKIGWYHFANSWDESPIQQAAFFVSKMPKGYDLIPCLDMEAGAPSIDKGKWAKRFIREVNDLTGQECMVYGSSYYLETCFRYINIAGSPLWIAAVARDGGPLDFKYAHIPRPWLPSEVAFHQYNWHAKIPGIPGGCDLSRPIHPGLATAHQL